jgi:3-oxoacyl-[acyl-carrier protein] reductase
LPKPSTPNLPQPNKPVALVTGASRGIGRAVAAELSKSHSVVATYRENREAAESLRNETGAEMIPSDISSGADRDKLVAHLRATYGNLDLLVNNAGIAPRERRDMLEAI